MPRRSFKLKPLFLSIACIAGAAAGSAGASDRGLTLQQRNAAALALSPVIISERPDAVQGYAVDAQQVRQMVNRDLQALTSSHDIGTAWKRLGITPSDIVGVRISTGGGPGMCTHSALVKAITDGLQTAGVPASQIIIFDKFQDKMVQAGYLPRAPSGLQPAIESITATNNYDPDVYYSNGIIGSLISGDFMFTQSLNSTDFDSRSVLSRSYYTKFVTQICTKIINVPVLNYNEFFGIDACLSGLALGIVDNNRRFVGPPSYGDPSIDEILFQGFLRRKVVVHILDALTAQCAGGPSFAPQYCQSFGAIYAGRDPVAIDSLALPRLEKMRRDQGIPSAGNTSSYVRSAAVLSLGTTDRRRIQFLRVP
jgi:hypothetical protein